MSKKSFRVGRAKTGLGLFATAEIAKSDIIVVYRGRRILTKNAQTTETKRGTKYMFEINSRWTLDGSSRRNLARYANHSCRPNAESELLRGQIVLRARKRIHPDDEITYDYGKDYFNMFIRPHGCRCEKCAEKRRARRGSKVVKKKIKKTT